jgi:hypothetical protein
MEREMKRFELAVYGALTLILPAISFYEDMTQLASRHPEFDRLTAKEHCAKSRNYYDPDFNSDSTHFFGQTNEDLIARPAYVRNSQRKIIAWKPVPWTIPSVDELDTMEKLLPDYEDPVLRQRKVVTKSYISAPTTIHFPTQLPVKTRMNISIL